MKKYWIAVACKEHVSRAVREGVAQVCHGKEAPLRRMKMGDGIIYYSPRLVFRGSDRCQSFTAIGKVLSTTPYLFKMNENFSPWRHDIEYFEAQEVSIYPLLDSLTFVDNKQKWGIKFRYGFFEISQDDFNTIAKAMSAKLCPKK